MGGAWVGQGYKNLFGINIFKLNGVEDLVGDSDAGRNTSGPDKAIPGLKMFIRYRKRRNGISFGHDRRTGKEEISKSWKSVLEKRILGNLCKAVVGNN